MNSDAELKKLEKAVGYRFKDRDILLLALTHASFGDGAAGQTDNQRLEFLGDRVLNLLTAEKLYEIFSGVDEGGLAPRLNALVRKETCARVAREIGLGDFLRLSKSEHKTGGRDKDSILGDACEALLGAIYIDGGVDAARDFFDAFWKKELKAVVKKPKDPKTLLQEWALARGLGVPDYKTVGRSGPDHAPKFKVEVSIEGIDPERGKGDSKRAAERAAAAALFERESMA